MKLKSLIIISLFFLYAACEAQKDESINLKEMIGQMIMVGFRGMEVESLDQKLLNQIDQGYIGGIILFDYDIKSKSSKRNIKSPEQVKSLIADIQKLSIIPLFVAVDQEGGMINRLKPKYGFPKIASAKYLGNINNLDSTRHYAFLNANNLKHLGFNVNFAPVVDIDVNPYNPVIGKYERSFSNQSAIVIKHAKAWIEIHDSLGIISTLKHFPGHGSSDADSHEGFTDITNYWSEEELVPFQELSKLPYQIGIMTAHVFNSKLDPVYPATLSKQTIHAILRDDWGFNGLIFSDDLQMKAVNKLYDMNTILKNSINAGVDVLVFGNNLEYNDMIPEDVINKVVKLVESGEISRKNIGDAYHRIMKAKKDLN